MKKKIVSGFILSALICFVLVGCGCSCGNRDIFDTNYTYDKAIIKLQDNQTIVVNVKQWKDYDDGEQLQIIAEDGTVYLTNSFNCTLIKESE